MLSLCLYYDPPARGAALLPSDTGRRGDVRSPGSGSSATLHPPPFALYYVYASVPLTCWFIPGAVAAASRVAVAVRDIGRTSISTGPVVRYPHVQTAAVVRRPDHPTRVTSVTEADGRAEWELRSRAMEEGQAARRRVPGARVCCGGPDDWPTCPSTSWRPGPAYHSPQWPESSPGKLAPSLRMFQRLLAAAGLSLVVVDADGRVVQPMRESDDVRNGGDRRYPSHLDTILDPRSGEWWGDAYGLARPPETFWRNRARRDAMRAMSEYETRAHLHRHESPPPEWEAITRLQMRAGLAAGVPPGPDPGSQRGRPQRPGLGRQWVTLRSHPFRRYAPSPFARAAGHGH